MPEARLAKALETLRAQIDKHSPNRSRQSDGWIGDKAHAARKSDHNPDKNGVVHAIDITNDTEHGVDGLELANVLLDSRDPRIDYVISRGKIAYGAGGHNPWDWQEYHGINKHDHHTHISVVDDPALADSTKAWNLTELTNRGHTNPPAEPKFKTVQMGDEGPDVELAQRLLNSWGATLKVDGKFGKSTKAAAKEFQEVHNLVADGVIGRYTWEQLDKPKTL